MILKRLLSRVLFPNGRHQSLEAAAVERYATYKNSAEAIGLDESLLFLSFDCDTDLDADVVLNVHGFLSDLGIVASYAVPGAQLERQPGPYRELARLGAEFINHGARPHTEWTGEQWIPRTFYHEMPEEEVVDDIIQGDRIIRDVLEVEPNGFRAPHFGSYQSEEQLKVIYDAVTELGYAYCSTTLPGLGLANGPVNVCGKVVEIPCFGSVRNPETLLDSWTYLVDKVHYRLKDDYAELLEETLRICREQEIPAIFNWYADPCHVVGQPAFMRAMERIKEEKIESVTGSQIAERFGR